MRSHLVGQSNRADIRRLRQLEADLAEREDRMATLERRVVDLMSQRDGLSERNRSIETDRQVSRISEAHSAQPQPDDRKELMARHDRERAHAEWLEEKLASLTEAASRLGADLALETAQRKVVEAGLLATETILAQGECPARSDREMPSARARCDLTGRILLYVGGCPRQVAQLRRFVDDSGGALLSHDGGIEESLSLLPGLVSRSERVFFPVECIGHEATNAVKRLCEAGGTPFRPVRSASLASFVHAISLA